MINWGIIGCGDVAEIKSGPAFQQVAQSTLGAVMRRDGVKAANFAKRHQVPHWYDSAEALLADESINAVYIATPPSSHLVYARAALEAGKSVYLEKPITPTLSEAETLESLVAQSASKLTVAHYRRELPAFLKVKELLASDAIGRVSLAEMTVLQPAKSEIIAETEENWRLTPSISGGGYFYDIGPHHLDLMCHFFGPYQAVHGFSAQQDPSSTAPDITTGVIAFANGVQFRGAWCFNVARSLAQEKCVLFGEKGSIEFSFYGQQVVFNQEGQRQTFDFEAEPHVQKPMIEKTVAYFLGKGENPCPITEAVTVSRLLDAFSKSV